MKEDLTLSSGSGWSFPSFTFFNSNALSKIVTISYWKFTLKTWLSKVVYSRHTSLSPSSYSLVLFSGIAVSHFTLSITVKTLGIGSTWTDLLGGKQTGSNRIATRRKHGRAFWEPNEIASDERYFTGFSAFWRCWDVEDVGQAEVA